MHVGIAQPQLWEGEARIGVLFACVLVLAVLFYNSPSPAVEGEA